MEVEKVVATIVPVTVNDTAMMDTATELGSEVKKIVVENDEQYRLAGEFGVKLKTKMSEVTEFFSPLKKAAHDSHKKICDREKAVLAPLKEAEKILKAAMSDYMKRIEQQRIEAEKEARRLAQEEADRNLLAAIEAEDAGDMFGAEIAMMNAELADHASRNTIVEHADIGMKGVSVKKDYELLEFDATKIPVCINGIIVRPVDEKALLRAIKESKGTLKIDGLRYQEKETVSFRKG